ncbi:MAG TPA: SulP family inorganic anion transporter [Bdellovibrio sp.]|nr:SulP family inorganic anion transporter [Bdellovibrio sp.]
MFEKLQKEFMRSDFVAGLTAATVVIPKAMAYATVAGLPVAVGIYTSFIPLIVYAFVGGSKVLSVSTTTTLAVLTESEIGFSDPSHLISTTMTLTLLVGFVLLISSILRLGFLANFISTPVLTGFRGGIGLVIILDQIPKMLGLHISKHSFFSDIISTFQHLSETSLTTFALALLTIGTLVGLEKFKPRWPAPLFVVVGGILASWFFHLENRGVSTVGLIPQGLPSLTLPDISLWQQLLPGALGIALMSFTETVAVGRSFRKSEEPLINANRELAATGLANIFGSFLGAMPAGGGASQTAVARASGGRTQLVSLVTAAFALATLLFLAPVLQLLPNAVMAGIVTVYSLGLIQLNDFKEIFRIRAMEFRWALASCLGVLLFGTLNGILIAIVMSLIGLASMSARPTVSILARKRGTNVVRPLSDEYPDDETFDGLLMIRPEGRIFFLNAESVADRIRNLIETHRPQVVLLDLSRVSDIEYSALCMLQEAEKRQVEGEITLWLSGLNPDVLKVVRNSGLADRLGRERMLFNAQLAIERFLRQQHPKVTSEIAPPQIFH